MKKIVPLLLLFVSLSVFAQDNYYTIPEGYEESISAENYKYLVDLSVEAISKDYKIKSIDSGEVTLEEGQDYTVVNLHNLIYRCADIPKEYWQETISSHFASMKESVNDQQQLDPEDYESLTEYFSIRIYPDYYFDNYGGTENFIVRTDLEGTLSVLMFDLPSTFTPVTKEIFDSWGKFADEVFKVAQQNVNKQEFYKATQTFQVNDNEIELHFAENEDYAASMALDLEANAPEFIGDWGSVVAIPNKGIINVCEVSKENPLDYVLFIQRMKSVVEQFYNEHPQSVSTDFYWYYQGKFTKIMVEESAGETKVFSPMGLTELMSQDD